ncbi:Sulfite exporter TauE/SafE [Streptoalloteichus tenebrarius]|uniref:Sulfite exporter TauE/SafE n=1 Tax=Streptoalloteichus tenebrarius (strain ATCC 17920 / DSM 40477 / JCM 4838 / CBS 697.72 / NBRC 16177 / NCIMB 11028 / NRRL B-12390 / A12253. 1 / ISP 5477) TaxID=1933 RepID=A0ABT1HXA7_STRSD|nr:sulfite exporter TauE/SafE family protein [Streptoalloteichus tenebrarius]MCP2260030.1 Sulfite exporter TauE/SafE [Streptoalloteichus tenebrarius]BFF03854.1 hypothetical protein GCM10020241_55290 [Streptoalloteichus tenebrarius]
MAGDRPVRLPLGVVMSLTAVLVTGLAAGGVSCAAVQGGLLAGVVARQRPEPVSCHAEPSGCCGESGGVASSPEDERSPARRLGDDLAPVAGFLAGKLVSHTALGALLGALGGVVQLSSDVRLVLQFVAGVVVVALGLAQLGVPGFRRIVVRTPRSWSGAVSASARSRAALAPAALGCATVLVPCGVTVSVEALALTTGSALGGAATMAVFVAGTAPLFAVLGYAARRAATAWRGRLATVTGAVVVVMGLVTVNGGLELAGSPLAASAVVRAMGFDDPPARAVRDANGGQVVTITARASSYSPPRIEASAGVPTTVVIRSEGVQGCARAFVVPARGVDQLLPVHGETRIELGVLQPGELTFACSMGMYRGTITVL